MNRSNGEDLHDPLRLRTKPPLGSMGIQPMEAGSQPQQRMGKLTGLLDTQADEMSGREYQNWADMVTRQGFRIFTSQGSPWEVTPFHSALQGSARVVTPFQPDRITGPIQFIRMLLDSWNLTTADAAALLGFEQADQANVEAILAGRLSLRGRDVRDRIATLFRIKSLISELFRDGEYGWMGTPRPEFANRSPLEMLREGSMENLLTLRQYVEHISGL